MSSSKRKLNSDDYDEPSTSKKHMTTKNLPQAVKRPKSLFERESSTSSGKWSRNNFSANFAQLNSSAWVESNKTVDLRESNFFGFL